MVRISHVGCFQDKSELSPPPTAYPYPVSVPGPRDTGGRGELGMITGGLTPTCVPDVRPDVTTGGRSGSLALVDRS
eukprot:scaffold278138_cov24-Tisochrysis_lutea.AAC.1